MTAEQVEGGKLFAIPYRGLDLGVDLNARLIEHLVAHPMWLAAALGEDERRLTAVWIATTPDIWRWEVWNGGTLAGLILMSRLVPMTDAVFHFTLFPSNESGVTLFGARRLLWNFLGHIFEQFQLQRVSAEVPEHVPKLAHFLRQRLGFRYEGETDVARLEKNRGVARLDVPGAPTWIASQGSRRERAHWNGTKWSDLILLRLLRSEYETRASLGLLPQATRENPSNGISDVTRREPSAVSAVDASGNAARLPGPAVQSPL